MKSVFAILLLLTANTFATIEKNTRVLRNVPRNLALKTTNKNDKNSKDRKLFLEEANMPQGNVYAEQLQNTNSNLNEMMGHSRRQTEMKQVGQWFADVDERLDDFRDAVARKLNELHMALQRPKVPMFHQFGGNPFAAASGMQSMMSSGGASGMSMPTMGASLSEGSSRMRAL